LNRAGIEGSCGAKLCSGESTKEGPQPGGFDDGDMEALLKEPEVNRDVWGPAALEQRRERTRQHLASIAARCESWIKRNRYYYELLSRLLRFLVEPEKNVLSICCGTGNLLNAVRPSTGKIRGHRLVDDEQAAYEYWLRRATACAEAEQAYGPQVIYRMRYVDLVDQPERAMRSLLDFFGERYAAECLELLAQRINSANVRPDFDEREAGTNAKTVEQARQLSEQLQKSPQPCEASPEVAAKLEADFERQVEYHATLDAKLNDATTLIRHLQEQSELRDTLAAAGQM
jgi:hypothetical protein